MNNLELLFIGEFYLITYYKPKISIYEKND